VAALFTWVVVNNGLRIADNYAWVWSIGAITIVAMKLLAKYGKHADQETSQGAVLAVVSAIPMARHLVPELAVLPKRTTAIVLGSAVAILGIVSLTRPAPDTVPESGLLSYEYYVLARNLALTDNIVEAMKAAELARKPDISGNHIEAVNKVEKYFFPKTKQPQEALSAFYNATKLSPKARLTNKNGSKKSEKPNNAEKIVALRALIEKYPDFELPYASLAETLAIENKSMKVKNTKETTAAKEVKEEEVKNEVKKTIAIDLDDPRALIERAYQINPENSFVLLAYFHVTETNVRESKWYYYKALKIVEDMGGSGAWFCGLAANGVSHFGEAEDELDRLEKQNQELKQETEKLKKIEKESNRMRALLKPLVKDDENNGADSQPSTK
jgi:cell division protein FtsB